ncbi:MAG: hypothetical protein EBZ14_05115, partial [Gammaproteobacteria bacterium]|nr:hypothetical protein [Gammaproteobacteria bacterium]
MPSDAERIRERLAQPPETASVTGFVAGEGIFRLDLRFDISKLKQALAECLLKTGYSDDEWKSKGFGVLPLTHRPGQQVPSGIDLSGRYWMR